MAVPKKVLKRQTLRNIEYYGLQEIFDELYQKSLENRKFKNLMELILMEENIKLAYRNMKKNDGSTTPGVDGKTIEHLAKMTEKEVIELVRNKLEWYTPKAIRRVEIDKGNGKKRPLGIASIEDRLIQQCILQVLEPICEAKFHDRSNGFRPNRGVENALAQAEKLIQSNKLYIVVDIDIKGFFDNVSHGKLLKQLWTIGIQDKKLISIISAMLKGEIAEIGFPEKGTAQGSIISPLLSNVVLNELDWWIASQWEFMPTRHVYKEAIKVNGTQSKSKKYRALRNSTLKECFIVRYADDFKIFCRKHKDAVVMFEATKQWLKTRLGLDISPEKSKIVNLKHSYSEFLGFRIKVHKKGKDTKCKPPVDKYVVKSHISEKALKKIKTNAKERIIAIQKTNGSRAGEYAIRDYNSFVMGIQNYYSMATCVNPDMQTLAYEIKTSIKIRLNTRVKRRTNEALTPYLSERYGKSKELRFINGVPLVPIGYVQHRVPLHKKAVVNKYTAEGRKEIHKQLETVDIERVHELMRNPISNETVEFNDNCVSLFVAQRGNCAICKLPLTLENMRCVHKVPKSCGGDDKDNNLIIVHKEIERLIKSQDSKEIKRILNKYKLESNQRRKVNTIRKNAGLEEIDVKTLDKEL